MTENLHGVPVSQIQTWCRRLRSMPLDADPERFVLELFRDVYQAAPDEKRATAIVEHILATLIEANATDA